MPHTQDERVDPIVKIPHFSAHEGSLVPRLLCVGGEGPGNKANMRETLVKGEQLTDN